MFGTKQMAGLDALNPREPCPASMPRQESKRLRRELSVEGLRNLRKRVQPRWHGCEREPLRGAVKVQWPHADYIARQPKLTARVIPPGKGKFADQPPKRRLFPPQEAFEKDRSVRELLLGRTIDAEGASELGAIVEANIRHEPI